MRRRVGLKDLVIKNVVATIIGGACPKGVRLFERYVPDTALLLPDLRARVRRAFGLKVSWFPAHSQRRKAATRGGVSNEWLSQAPGCKGSRERCAVQGRTLRSAGGAGDSGLQGAQGMARPLSTVKFQR